MRGESWVGTGARVSLGSKGLAREFSFVTPFPHEEIGGLILPAGYRPSRAAQAQYPSGDVAICRWAQKGKERCLFSLSYLLR
ncbi:hypothetical protein [Candidatus Methylacidithermus pantelleriae]|uniref:hypothetical protein n=1 Tax=Candidatus Methylacidithermus pantelleriae TaxID=2744239 RepID=UPI00157C9D9B|nr:hypothetical protein [Candidatus Methylacidithermus pantelleriae]